MPPKPIPEPNLHHDEIHPDSFKQSDTHGVTLPIRTSPYDRPELEGRPQRHAAGESHDRDGGGPSLPSGDGPAMVVSRQTTESTLELMLSDNDDWAWEDVDSSSEDDNASTSSSLWPEPSSSPTYLPLGIPKLGLPKLVYSPIARPLDIRLLTLLPGKRSDPIRIELRHTELSESHVPPFEALSYVWGNPKKRSKIMVVQRTKNSSLSVTRNLATVLPYLRDAVEPRTLWIDAICVDQKNLDERSQQVKRMAEIYSQATRVIAWIGEEARNSSLALQTMSDFGSKVVVDWLTQTMKPTLDDPAEAHWADEDQDLRLSEDSWWLIFHLLKREWFERLWIWQEIRLGSSQSILKCGESEMKWHTFSTAMFCARNKGFRWDTVPSDFYRCRNQVFNLCNKHPILTFSHIASITKYCKCEDKRDHVFGLMSMVPHKFRPKIEPDYTKSVGEIYQELVLELFKTDGDLRVLTECELCDTSNIENRLPSWVPDWSNPRSCMEPLSWKTAAKSIAEYKFLGHGILEVTGSKFATVKHVLALDHWDWGLYNEILQSISTIKRFVESETKEPLSASGARALCRALAANYFSHTHEPPHPNWASFDSGIELLTDIEKHQRMLDGGGEWSPAILRYMTFSRHTLAHRCFFITDDGSLGVGPSTTQPGDNIAILLGCDSAMLLRPVYTESNQYQLVGEAYCDDFTTGEALLGPLPEDVESVACTARGGTFFGYLNRKTGDLQVEDPRLARIPLPEGWRRSTQEELDGCEGISFFINDETRQYFDSRTKDPRLTADELRKRGVQLQSFKLV